MKKKQIILVLILSMQLYAAPVHVGASRSTDISFKEYFVKDDTMLKLRGTGMLRYLSLFNVYKGSLYLPEGTPSEAALSKIPKRFEVEYLRRFRGEDFGPATRKLIARNVSVETFKKLESKIDQHSSFYEDVEPGDRYSLTYIPGQGTELALNGNPKGTVNGPEFANALFSIWLGPYPLDENFKSQLLGLK